MIQKKEIEMSKEKVLLVGNGIYRAFHGEDESWENVLRFVKKNSKNRECP